MDFIDANLFAKLVKLAEKSGEKIDNFLWLSVFGKLREADHVCVEQRYIFERVNHTLVIHYALQHMQWH